jgi:hypothetical protein
MPVFRLEAVFPPSLRLLATLARHIAHWAKLATELPQNTNRNNRNVVIEAVLDIVIEKKAQNV